METPVPVYIMNSELPNQVGKLTGLNLCKIIDSIVPRQVMGSQHFNGIWSIWIKTQEARHHFREIGSIEIDNIKI